MIRSLRVAMAARLTVDAVVAGAAEALPGGLTRLRSAAFPVSKDLNALWLPFAARQADLDAATALTAGRITAPAPADVLVAPPGWELDGELLLVAPDAAPAWPASVVEVEPGDLHAPRLAVWRAQDEDPDEADELARMQLALGEHPDTRVLAVLADDAPVAWCMVVGGAIDDVWTQPAHRGRGLGRAVTRAALAAGGWYLGVDAGNAPARALYAAEGFREAGHLVVAEPAG